MSSSYLPQREQELDTWFAAFKTKIAAAPTTYGLVAADGTALTNAYNAWHTAYLLAVDPATRTKSAIVAKNTQKAIIIPLIRGYARTIGANKAVSDALKTDLGLHVRDTAPTPVPPPSTMPVLQVDKVAQGYMDLSAKDEGSDSPRARAAGSVGMLLYRIVAEEAVNSPAQATFQAFVGRPKLTSTFTEADRGKMVTYFARWTNARGEVGPWSAAVSMAIAA